MDLVAMATDLALVEATHLGVVLLGPIHLALPMLSKHSSLEVSPMEVPLLDL